MCYYNGQKVSRAEFIELKKLEKPVKNYDFIDKGLISGFTDTPVAVILPNEARDNFDIVQMEWGFIPGFLENREQVIKFRTGYKGTNGKWVEGKPSLNAKGENLFISEKTKGKSMFADAARERRCLVLSTGFYEWRHIYPKNKRTGEPVKTPVKYPYYIGVKDAPYFFMAAVWTPWTDRETGEHVNTVALTTAPANRLMLQVHNSRKRMPTILNDDQAWEWITGNLSDGQIQEIALTQFPWEKMDACTITKEFQSLLDPTAPFSYSELPAIDLSLESESPGESVNVQSSLF